MCVCTQCVRVHACAHLCVYICVCICVYMRVHICACIHLGVCMFMCFFLVYSFECARHMCVLVCIIFMPLYMRCLNYMIRDEMFVDSMKKYRIIMALASLVCNCHNCSNYLSCI